MLFIKKKAKDAEIIAAKAAEEAKAAEGIQEAPKDGQTRYCCSPSLATCLLARAW